MAGRTAVSRGGRQALPPRLARARAHALGGALQGGRDGRAVARGAEALAHERGAEVEVARQAVEREVARGEHPPEPRDLLVERDLAARVEDRPVEQVLVVVHAPRLAGVAVALALVGVLGRVARADGARELQQVGLSAARQDRGDRRRHPGRRGRAGALAVAHCATTS